jgi:lipopolysaccharide/colanic/teichoic acid biosynthesis glycosyltransferase
VSEVEQVGVTYDNMAIFSDMENVPIGPMFVGNDWVSSLDAVPGRITETLPGDGKRLFDIVFSLTLLLLCGPVLLSAMLALWLSSLGCKPVIYRQVRVGLYGRRFTLLKLRTMQMDAEPHGPSMAAVNDSRVTRIGRILRRSRIDELPQLINVLCGEMSLIGPRPERPEFVSRFETEIEGYSLRHLVKPGVTGLAQVHNGYAANLQDAAVKLYYDLNYIKNDSLRLDLQILLKTLPVVFFGWGAR